MRSDGVRVKWWHVRWFDVAVAVLLTAYAQAEMVYEGTDVARAVAVSLVITGSLLWRRTAPVSAALVVVGTYGLWVFFLGSTPQPMANALAVLLAVYSVTAFSGLRAAAPVLVLAVVSFAAVESSLGTPVNVIADLVISGVVCAIGWFVSQRRREVANQLATAEADVRSADARAEQALVDERRRMARELHDVVSHAVTVVVLQARGGRAMLDHDPDQTRVALEAIEVAGLEALGDMRRLVTLLREPNLDTAPQPSLNSLESLVATARTSGSDVTLAIHGEPVPLSTGAALTAYRLVQEAVTNALRHAPGRPVGIDVSYGDSAVTLCITNPAGTATAVSSGGHGLLGMRERIELYSGRLQYGRSGNRWEVRGTLPYNGGATQPNPMEVADKITVERT
jgi:signal transduction histidine kinase